MARRSPGFGLCEEWLEAPSLTAVGRRVAVRYRLTAQEAADLLQELRIALWHRGLAESVHAAWVVQVAAHKAVDIVRRRSRDRAHDRLLGYTQDRPGRDPELGYLLHARVEHLPARLRAFYELHYLEGLSERDIARRLGMCRASVRWLDRCCRREIIGGSARHARPGECAVLAPPKR